MEFEITEYVETPVPNESDLTEAYADGYADGWEKGRDAAYNLVLKAAEKCAKGGELHLFEMQELCDKVKSLCLPEDA